MTMIVGFAPDERGRAALQLAALLARSAGDDLVVGCVVPAPWVPGMARIDAEYRETLDKTADQALEQAKASLPTGLRTTFVRHAARSAPAGLLELADKHGADLIVLGSSSAGAFGHVALGSVADHLVHSSPVALALAPRGFRTRPGATVTRVSVAYGGSDSQETLVVAAAPVAGRLGAELRIVSLAVWTHPAYTTTLGTDPEDLVMEEWTKSVRSTADAALAQVEDPASPRHAETVIGRGRSWGEAIDDVSWEDDEVLVVGSGAHGRAAHVFLGSRATKILRNSPVPVVVLPRAHAEQLAELATGS